MIFAQKVCIYRERERAYLSLCVRAQEVLHSFLLHTLERNFAQPLAQPLIFSHINKYFLTYKQILIESNTIVESIEIINPGPQEYSTKF